MLSLNMEEIRGIYSKLADDESKEIFLNRLQFSITDNYKYIRRIVGLEDMGDQLKKIEKENKKLLAFGTGHYANFVVNYIFPDIKWECFVDNFTYGKKFFGFDVVSFEEFKEKYFDAVVLISPANKHQEIYNQLIEAGFPKSQIVDFGGWLVSKNHLEVDRKQYFELKPSNTQKESFVDAGCLDGKTSKQFIEWCNGEYENIWAFEPDEECYKKCKEILVAEENCKVFNCGILDQEGIVKFRMRDCGCSTVVNDGEVEIKAIKLDEVLKGEKVTFIKMDIEGSELKALIGAEETIKTQKPRLAISIYHKPEDIIEIPKLLLNYNDKYSFKIRHYSFATTETVLYAF